MNTVFQQRQQQLRAQLTTRNLDAFLVLGTENLRYLSGFSGHASYGIITQEANYFITDYRYVEQAITQCPDFEVYSRERVKETLGSCIKKHLPQVEKLGFDAAFVSFSVWQDIASELGSITTYPLTGVVEKLRMVKDQWEIAQTRAAAKISDQALAELMPYFVQGASERDLAIELEYRMKKIGSEDLSFDTIMLFAQRSSLPHGIPSTQQLQHGDFITLDFGAVINGYRSDMTRSYVLGEASAKQRDVYQTVAQAQQAAIEILKPGLPSIEAYNASQAIIDASPFAQFSGAGLGHGVGLFLHEQPFIGPGCDYVLEPGNIITIEPGIYIPDFGGVRLEDDILITETGYEILTHAPKPFII